MNITINYGPGNSIVKDIRDTSEIRESWVEALGADPSRVQICVNGQPYSGPLSEGDVVELRTKANEKGAGVRISFGPGNSITKDITHTEEIEDSWIEALGADPSRVEFCVNGQPYDGELHAGETVELRTRANEKGC